MENKFLLAIQKNEVGKFLSGEGDYFIHGNEWSGGYNKHDSGGTFGHIKNSVILKQIDEEIVYRILDREYVVLMQNTPSACLVFDVVMLVWRYFTTFEDGYFKEKWEFSDDFLKLLKKGYHFYVDGNNLTDKELYELMVANRKLLKERFNFVI